MDIKDNKVPDKDVKNGGKDVARPQDELGPYVPDKRAHFAGMIMQGIAANAALHRQSATAALACDLADQLIDELDKPPVREQQERAQQEREERAKAQREQRQAEIKLAEEREKEDRERLEKDQRERDKKSSNEASKLSP